MQQMKFAFEMSIDTISTCISANDRIVIALDVTQNAQEVEHAYLDPTGLSDLSGYGIYDGVEAKTRKSQARFQII